MDSPILEVAIGMVFTFGIVAALGAVLTELVARFLGLRARFLLLGLRELLDGTGVTNVHLTHARTSYERFKNLSRNPPPDQSPVSATEALLGTPIMRTQGMPGSITSRAVTITKKPGSGARQAKMQISPTAWLWRNPLRELPSYISARSFSAAVFDLVVPSSSGKAGLDQIRAQVNSIQGVPALTEPLQSLLKTSGDNVEAFREAVEGWYDDHMDRVSGWYKRHVAKWSLAFGALLVLLLNINSITIATTLYSNDTIRSTVTALAVDAENCPAGQDLTACLNTLQGQLERANASGLPIGWPVVAECRDDPEQCPFWQARGILAKDNDVWDWRPLTVVLGWAITILALVPGARFWFDLLAKLGSLRSTGPKPQNTQTGQASN